jgi:hypothetical protein
MKLDVITQQELDQLESKIESILEQVSNLSNHPDHIIYNTREFQQNLGVSERTQQTWRDNGIIGFSKVQGTIFYRMSDIQKMLEKNHVPAR